MIAVKMERRVCYDDLGKRQCSSAGVGRVSLVTTGRGLLFMEDSMRLRVQTAGFTIDVSLRRSKLRDAVLKVAQWLDSEHNHAASVTGGDSTLTVMREDVDDGLMLVHPSLLDAADDLAQRLDKLAASAGDVQALCSVGAYGRLRSGGEQ